MRQSTYFIPTLKETPNDAVVPSHILMLRAGLIRMISAGVYSYLPLGYKVLKKVTDIIREEMDGIGGQEFHLPAINPKEIWEQTNRVEAFGDTMFHIKNRDYVLAPTHEEIITLHARKVVKSYKDMPQIWYQIQMKFRNEARPRSGVIRGRQFLMKDAYTLDTSEENLDKSYALHDGAYRRIFDRCGLKYFIVGASSGAMGGSGSEEFMVESSAGEDTVAYCEESGYAANVEVAESKVPPIERENESREIEEIHTPNVRSIDELCEFLKIKETQCAKSRVYIADGKPYLVLMLGNEEVNESKLERVLGTGVRSAHPEELLEITGAEAGSIGPVDYKKGRILADLKLKDANNLFSGANKTDYHIGGIDLRRDVPDIEYHDLRIVKDGEESPDGGGTLKVFTAIELGHIFKLGTKYSAAMGATFLNENGRDNPIIMGSYGIGVDRVIACFIEQSHDDNGIIWNRTLAPFDIHLLGLNIKKGRVREVCESVYEQCKALGFDVLYDDRPDAQPGFKMNDADLIGLPMQIVIGERKLKEDKVEIKIRKTNERYDIPLTELTGKIEELMPKE